MSDTFGRIADDELANIVETATAEESGGKRPHTWGLVRSALLELQHHRARISAQQTLADKVRAKIAALSPAQADKALSDLRASLAGDPAAHPERLSDNYLANRAAHIDSMAADGESMDALISQRRTDERRAIAEIQQRRAADMTPDERDALDARRYRRLRVLGCAPTGSRHLEHGEVMCFTTLDAHIDGDIAVHPSRGEVKP
jgi:hypothetical protein